MKQIYIALLAACFMFNANAQNDKGKKVKTKFLQLPGYDISSIDPSTVTAEFVVGEGSFGTEKLKDTKSICVPKNGGIKDAVEVTTYYYELPFNKPASILIAKDGSGNIVYGEKVSDNSAGSAKFGFDKCEYWIAEKMKKEWESKSSSFKSSTLSSESADLHQKAINSAKQNVYPAFVEEEFQVFTAKSKDHDYAKLNKAQESAISAYEAIYQNGPDASSFENLKSSIEVWNKALEELDLEDKKARINKNIAKGIYENLANAYMYTYQTRQALKAAMAGKKLYGNFSNNRSNALDARIQVMGTREIASDKNAGTIADVSRLNSIGRDVGSGNVSVKQLPNSDYDRVNSEYNSYRSNVFSNKMETSSEMEEEAIASGDVGRYDKYVTPGAGGKMIMMSPLTMAPKLEELPKEICGITDLKQLIIISNDIASVPAEIGQLKMLTKLVLTKNKVESLPPEIGELNELKTLNLSDNPLTSLPKEIANCTALKTLNLKGTKISGEMQKQLSTWLPNAKIKY
ncbi:MAG: leucine-rich repeat domain-containing protein [Flavobacteriales bacterium]|nr:leucine-rich repeat domain-containing protein [Flavobacteriales bacterium]